MSREDEQRSPIPARSDSKPALFPTQHDAACSVDALITALTAFQECVRRSAAIVANMSTALAACRERTDRHVLPE